MRAKLLTAASFLMLSTTSALALGTITMTSTPYPDSIVVEVDVVDDGSAALCAWLAITRGGVDVYYFERDLGNNYTATFVDTDVEPGTSYCYNMALRAAPGPVPCFLGDLCYAFDCFCFIETCANAGPEPALIGHGYLSSMFPDGTPVDDNEVTALLYDCDSSTEFITLHAIPPEAQPYVDTETAVRVSGGYWCCWAQCVWLLSAEVVTAQQCPVRAEPATWGRVKAMYRE